MAVVNNAVAVVADQPAVTGTNVTLQINVQTDTGRAYSTNLTVPISDTAGQVDNAIFSLVQQTVQNFGDTMPNNASLMVLGGRT